MTFLLDIDKSNTYLRVMRRSLLLLALLSSVAAAQTNFYAISPVVLNNGDSLHRNLGAISRTTTYNFPVTIAGEGHFSIRLYPAYNGITRGYLTIDSGSYIGISKFTLSVTGDSIQNVWLPDDTASIGFTGSIFKQGPGWSLIMVVKAEASGNGGILSIAKSNAIASVITPSAGYDVWLKRSDSLAVFVTPQWFWDNMIAGSGVTLSVLTDTVSARELALKNWADGKFLTGFTETDPGATPIAEAARDTASLANRQAHTALTKAEAARDTASEARLEVLNALLQTSDSLAARFKATCDSLADLALRLGDTATAVKLWASGVFIKADTASLAVLGDLLYARSGGGAAVDTSLLVGNNRDDLNIQGDKWFKGHVMLTKQLWIYDSTHARYRNMLQYDNYVLDIGINAANYTYFWSNNSKVIAFSAGGAETQNNMYIWAKGNSRIAIGTTTQPTTSNMKPLYVVGGAQITDTTRFGDWTTYSYIIPGGDLVKSSTRDIKTDISAIETPKDFEARILSVSPKRYRFKPEAYLRGVSDTLKGEDLTKALAEDAAQAAKQSERVVTGFIAEEFNPAFGIDPASKEIHTSDIIAAQWKAIQMLTARVKALEARLTKLEGAR
jgi:hypothetical protein